MEELKKHVIYDVLKNKYPMLDLDYVVLSIETYRGLETHKEAVIKAFEIINKRYNQQYIVIEEKMAAELSDIEVLLQLPDDDYYNERPKIKARSYDIPDIIPYWYAFLNPPYAVSYLTRDFVEFNETLFPNRQDTVVYRWNDDFSDYFDDGKEWWGTGLWSAYDKTTGIMVIIGASTTD